MEPLTPTPPATVAVLIPFAAYDDPHRRRALDHVLEHYRRHHPWPVTVSPELAEPEPWSKGEWVSRLVDSCSAEILILADADSFIAEPAVLAEAVRLVAVRNATWIVPHRLVHRLTPAATDEVYAGRRPRLGKTQRPAYTGIAGGGVTVLRRDTYQLVHGIDPRFLGWGGEDVAFGFALDTLAGPHTRLEGSLVHLWHPHPAPDLRGSAESEQLVADYRAALNRPRLMTALVNREPLPPPVQLAEPIRFRIANRNTLRVAGTVVRFVNGVHETTDADLADALRLHPAAREESRR